MRQDPTDLTGLDLLGKLLDQETVNSNSSQWSLDVPHQHPPEKVRLQQLAVLTALFVPEVANLPLPQQLEAVRCGRFIQLRNIEAYGPLLADMKGRYLMKGSLDDYDRPVILNKWKLDAGGLESAYEQLFKFKRLIESVKTFNSSILEADFYGIYSLMLTGAVGNAIDLSEIDTFLWKLIDPERRTFAKADLVNMYGYPSEDLFDLELDWL